MIFFGIIAAIIGSIFLFILLRLVHHEKLSLLQLFFLMPLIFSPTLQFLFHRHFAEFSKFLGLQKSYDVVLTFYLLYILVFCVVILINLNKLNKNFRKIVIEFAISQRESS